jgi:hypothetical protein
MLPRKVKTSSSSTLMSLILVFLIFGSVSAFVLSPRSFLTGDNLLLAQKKANDYKIQSKLSAIPLYAEKKRRRRKDKPGGGSDNMNEPSSSDEDELPDFDLVEDVDVVETKRSSVQGSVTSPSVINSGSLPRKTFDVNDPQIMEAMRATKGTGPVSVSSTRDLLRSRDRELEQKLVVNDVVQEVPSLAEYTRAKGDGSKIGKKAAKREARIAAALEAKGEGDSGEKSLFDLIPFLKSNGEKKSPIKVRIYVRFIF